MWTDYAYEERQQLIGSKSDKKNTRKVHWMWWWVVGILAFHVIFLLVGLFFMK